MSDITPKDASLSSTAAVRSDHGSRLGNRGSPTKDLTDNHEDDQDLDSTLDSESALGVPESPAESSTMRPAPSASLSSNADSFSWTADLMGRLSMEGSKPGGMPNTPDSMVAMGSAPSATLSEFSTVDAPGGSDQKEGLGHKGPRQGRRTSYGSNR